MMTSLKVWCLLPLTVLLVSITPTVTEVVQSMSQCEGFLLGDRSPQVPGVLEKGQIKGKNRYKAICQTYKNEKRFVTLYDTKNKIPVLSAYKYRGAERGRPENELWKVEPQLENMNDDINMDDCDNHVKYKRQASDNDYKTDNKYNRGHLFPPSYGFDDNDKISTFTLTNIVPQAILFNSGSWEKMEDYIKCILERYCENREGYVVTGAKPSSDKKLKDRVNIPSVLWSAFCCYNHQNKKWIAGAFWGDNKPDESKTTYLQMKTLEELHDELSTGHSRFEAFPGSKEIPSRCPLKETAKESLRELNVDRTCRYPPHHFTNIFQEDEDKHEDEEEERLTMTVVDSSSEPAELLP